MTSTKKCAECGRDLPLSEYNKTKNSKDGLQSRCRECFSRYNKARYAANKEKFKADIYAYREANPKKVCETRLKTCQKNPTQKNAYKAVEAALKAELLVKPDTCYGCGCGNDEHRIEAHHHDYAKPLEVIWLCTPCHRRMDQQRRIREGKPPSNRKTA